MSNCLEKALFTPGVPSFLCFTALLRWLESWCRQKIMCVACAQEFTPCCPTMHCRLAQQIDMTQQATRLLCSGISAEDNTQQHLRKEGSS